MYWWEWVSGGPERLWWPNALASLGLPTVLTVCAFLRYPQNWTWSYWRLVALSTALTGYLSFWREWDDGAVSLQMVPVFVLASAYLMWRGVRIRAMQAFAGCFISMLIPDITHAFLAFYNPQFPSFGFLAGVGGAGVGDGLLIYPGLAALIQIYERNRYFNDNGTRYMPGHDTLN